MNPSPIFPSWDGPPDKSFDVDAATGFVGKSILIGITEETGDGQVSARHEYQGVIAAATAAGIDVELGGVNEGQTWRMPPWLFELQPAAPGLYRLRSTGEEVEDPDFVFTMSIRLAKPH